MSVPRRILTPLVAGAALSALAVGVAEARGAIPLNNGEETTDAKGGGSGFFSYTIDGSELCYTLAVRNLTEPAVAAHIHIAPRRVAGPIVVPLTAPAGATGTTDECITADAEVLAEIAADPSAYYVNVHTPDFPGGEVRGQLK